MRIKNLPSIESMDGSQDALIIEQTDGSEDKSRKVSPSQIKQYVLGDMDDVPTEDSDNPVKSGGIFSTMGVPCIDPDTGKMYLKGGAAFGGNIDSSPTAGSNNAVASGGTKTYVDNLIKVQEFVGTVASIAGNNDATVSIPITIPSGYKILGVFSAAASNRNLAVTGTLMSSTAVSVYVANLYSIALSNVSIYVNVAFIKN